VCNSLRSIFNRRKNANFDSASVNMAEAGIRRIRLRMWMGLYLWPRLQFTRSATCLRVASISLGANLGINYWKWMYLEFAGQVVPCNRLGIGLRQVLVYLDPQPGKDPWTNHQGYSGRDTLLSSNWRKSEHSNKIILTEIQVIRRWRYRKRGKGRIFSQNKQIGNIIYLVQRSDTRAKRARAWLENALLKIEWL
jgi:hypothetical protein